MRPSSTLFLLPLALAVLLSTQPGAAPSPSAQPRVPVQLVAPPRAGLPAPPGLSAMLAGVTPSVVSISVQGSVPAQQNPLLQDPLFRRFFSIPDTPDTPQNRTFQSVGSGVIFDAARGYVVTNHHVVDRADRIVVSLSDRRRVNATLVASDPETDLAILKVEPDHLTAIPLGDSKQLHVGDYVVAIGNPFGVGQTATFGIVSALGRTGLGIEGYEDFIQTDASINPGNSGGALVDMSGRLIGINTAILSGSGGNVGIGFAIPIDMAKSIGQQLIAYGRVRRGALGVIIQDMTPRLAEAMGVSGSGGALVSQVSPQSAGARAGIRDGDVILAVDGVPITRSSQLRNEIGQRQPGTVVRLTLVRDRQEQFASVTLDALPSTVPAAPSRQQTPADQPLLGLSVGSIPTSDPNYGRLRGVHVEAVAPGSAADEAGLEAGDIIITANRQPLTTVAALTQIIRDRRGAPIVLQVRRGSSALYVALG